MEWKNLSNTRKRMDWLEILDLIENIGNQQWTTTKLGRKALEHWPLVNSDIIDDYSCYPSNIVIPEPPAEINSLLQNLKKSPEKHSNRCIYNIWVPSPNRIDNLKAIVQASSERITRNDLFNFICSEFNLKRSSVESILPFLKASGLLEEVGRNIYLTTPAAQSWLKTGNDLDFIRIIHSHMQCVGELLLVCKNNIIRNDLYSYSNLFGLNKEKTRWIIGFLLEAGLLEETQYLHLKTTPVGMKFITDLPLAEKPYKKINKDTPLIKKKKSSSSNELNQIIDSLIESSQNPGAGGLPPGQCFEESIAQIFSYLGFEANRVGGPGDTDVIVRWNDSEGNIITAIIDGKSKSHGKISHNDISEIAIDTHKEKNKADFVCIIGPGFTGDTIINHARKKSYALITDKDLIELARSSQQVGLSPQEISLIFHVPNGFSQLEELINSRQRELDIISVVISRLVQDQKVLGSLSPRDLWLILRESHISPSLEELLEITKLLSIPDIGVLSIAKKSLTPEHTTYTLNNTNKAAHRLKALSLAISNAN